MAELAAKEAQLDVQKAKLEKQRMEDKAKKAQEEADALKKKEESDANKNSTQVIYLDQTGVSAKDG